MRVLSGNAASRTAGDSVTLHSAQTASASHRTGSNNNSGARTPAYDADQLFGAHGVPVSSAIMALPAPIRALIIFFYVDILRPEDEFITQLRKLVITVGALLSFAGASLGVYNCITLTLSDAATGVACVVPFIFLVVFMPAYLLVRLDVLLTETVANLWMFCTHALVMAMAISFADWPSKESFILGAVLALLFRTQLMPLQLFLLTLSMIVVGVNDASFSRGQPEVTPWALPGLVMRGFATRLLFNFFSFGTVLCVLAALQLQLNESGRQTRVAQQSVDLARTVSECLAKYNTLRARDALDEASASQEGDKELIGHLHLLLDNLDKYRPHLPNWLLPISSDEDVDLAHDVRSQSQRSHTSQTSRTKHSSSRHSDDRRSSSSRNSDVDHALRTALRNEWLTLGTAVRYGISFAQVVFGSAVETGPTPEMVNEWVSWVHREAGHTAAAVHGFVGDMVQLSWNAASRAVQSEAKAARFLARAARHGREHGLRLHGAAMSGKARIQLAGGERVQALTISGAWMRGLEEMRKIGQRLGAMVVDHRTRGGSHFAVQYRAAAALEMMMCDHTDEPQRRAERDEAVSVAATAAGSGTRIGVFEVMRELQDDEVGEWMYVLQGREVTSTSAHQQGHVSDVPDGIAVAALEIRLTQLLQMWCDRDDARLVDELRGDGLAHGSASREPTGAADSTALPCGDALRSSLDRALQRRTRASSV